MRLLLDTPVWIWSLLEPERMDVRAREALEERGAELWLSPVSVLQLVRLIEQRRVEVDAAPEVWVQDALRAVPVRDAALSHEVARRAARWREAGVAPAARLIAATAEVYDLTLVTADRRLAELKGIRCLRTGDAGV